MEPAEVVERFYAEIWNRGDLAAIAALCHPDLVFRGSLGRAARDAAGFAQYVRDVRAALGDYTCTIEERVVEGDRVFARMRFAGVHRGTLEGVPATGAPVAWAGAALFRIEAGRVLELWVLGDRAGLREQLRAAADG